MNCHDVEKLINKYPLPPYSATNPSKLRVLIDLLVGVVEKGVAGEVVEMGCFNGGSSIFIQAVLKCLYSSKLFHVYDSWEGVPAPTYHDEFRPYPFHQGELATTREVFVATMTERGLPLPCIHSGWFASMPEAEYPKKVSFAYFDGDLYQPILDSWKTIYHRLSVGAVVLVDDYGMLRTPGVKKACDDFLRDKPETMVNCPFSYQGYCESGFAGGAVLVKK